MQSFNYGARNMERLNGLGTPKISDLYERTVQQDFYVTGINPETGKAKLGERLILNDKAQYGRISLVGIEQLESLYNQLAVVLAGKRKPE